MVKVTFIEPDGNRRDLDVAEGFTAMQAAVTNGVEGIEAECGGSCACATCHVYVDEADLGRVPDAGDNEANMLDMVTAERRGGSRLSCQIKLTADLDGLVLHVPESQS